MSARVDFLEARKRYIHELIAAGETPEGIAITLSMDPGQVRLIAMTPLREAARSPREDGK